MGLIDAYQGRRVYLDTNFFIYALENFAPTASAVARIGEMIQRCEILAFTSELTLAEVLVAPVRKGDQRIVDLYGDLIATRDGLSVVPVTRAIWTQAAAERASTAFKLPDAVHIATVRRTACEAFLTNDRGFSKLSGLAVLYLDDPALP
jgi:predicted nucleic acid-binding protein